MDELLNKAPCGFLTFADDGKITEVNATLLRVLGYERGELLQNHIEKIFSVAGRIFYQTHFFPLLKLQSTVEEIYLGLRSKTGENIPVLVNAVRRTQDETFFNDCIIVAMRQRNHYEDEILRAKREAEAALVAKDEFLSVVSHELRTPLNAILGWGRILQDDRIDTEILKKGLETIQRNAEIQTHLIEDILDFSRIISGKLQLEVRQVNLSEIVEAAIDNITPAANAKNIRLDTALDSKCVVSGDADRLQQVLWNLLTNAVKFTENGGRVQTFMKHAHSNVEISITDTGQGISPEFLPFVFERFQQSDKTKTRRHGGLGLGMAITRHIVELHGGTIRAESPGLNQGATFTVSLPVPAAQNGNSHAADQSENSRLPENTDFSVNDSTRLKGFQILIVDDEADARELITFVLARHGASVSAASSVPEAVEKFQTVKLDLIISDIEMPDEDGFSLIEKLKAFNNQRKHKIPAIALTAHARPAERLKALSAGYQIHLAKPIEPAELLAVVANFADWNNGE